MHWYALYITGFTTVLLFIILVALGTLTGYIEWYLPYRSWKQNARRRYVRGKRNRRQIQPRGILLRAMELLDEKDRRGEHMWAKISEDEGETIEAIVGYR